MWVGGLSIPTGDFGDIVKTGWNGQVVAGITGPNGRFGGRIDGLLSRHDWDGVADTHTTLLGANADLVVAAGTESAKVRPYALGGVGFFNVKSKSGSVSSDGETKFAFNVGAGLSLKAGERLSFYLEGRYINVQTDPSIGFIPITVGLRWGGN
ncbi:MAG TPA: outer membrane beta-barrel protein [Gemmatimonadales bacterium]